MHGLSSIHRRCDRVRYHPTSAYYFASLPMPLEPIIFVFLSWATATELMSQAIPFAYYLPGQAVVLTWAGH